VVTSYSLGSITIRTSPAFAICWSITKTWFTWPLIQWMCPSIVRQPCSIYGTGLRFGEALRLRMRDVDTRAGVLFVETFKGRARWVPFHRTLASELGRFLV
jgi:integrase